MRYETATFTMRYRVFDEGELVIVRDTGENAVVEQFHAPSHLQDEAIVFLRGHRTGIPASDCDPYRDPNLPVVRTMEHAPDKVVVWMETPTGERLIHDRVLGWTRFQRGGAPHYFREVEEAVGAATSYAASIGFPTIQHHPL
jgi:hypothetical protein